MNSDQPVLTSREEEVLAKLMEGKTIPEIAKELFIAESTVKTHEKQLHLKFGEHRRVPMINRARELGYPRRRPKA